MKNMRASLQSETSQGVYESRQGHRLSKPTRLLWLLYNTFLVPCSGSANSRVHRINKENKLKRMKTVPFAHFLNVHRAWWRSMWSLPRDYHGAGAPDRVYLCVTRAVMWKGGLLVSCLLEKLFFLHVSILPRSKLLSAESKAHALKLHLREHGMSGFIAVFIVSDEVDLEPNVLKWKLKGRKVFITCACSPQGRAACKKVDTVYFMVNIILHYIAGRRDQGQLHYTTLHYTTLHDITLHYATLIVRTRPFAFFFQK